MTFTDIVCFSKFAVPGVLISSSIYKNNRYKYGPSYADDGVRSRSNEGFFFSKYESNPWIQWHLREKTVVTGVIISTRRDCCGDKLRNVTIRAGLLGLNRTHSGIIININKLCGIFKGPGNTSMTYTINCTSAIMANYITLQMLGNYTSLQINELATVTEPHVLKGKRNVYKSLFNLVKRYCVCKNMHDSII